MRSNTDTSNTSTTSTTTSTSTRTPRTTRKKSRVPKLEYTEFLGEGSDAKVFKAKCPKTNQNYAIKIYSFGDSEDSKESFQNECRILASFRSHVNIVQYHGSVNNNKGDETGEGYLMLEYLAYGDIPYVIRHYELSFDEKLGIAYDIACGLSYLHENQILHKDIKPANILVSEDYRAKICDFAYAQKINEETNKLSGTPHYIAPELINAKINGFETLPYAESSDVYALGITYYSFFYELPPYAADIVFNDLMIQVLQNVRPAIPNESNPKVAKLIRHCWSAFDSDRPTAPDVMGKLDEIKVRNNSI